MQLLFQSIRCRKTKELVQSCLKMHHECTPPIKVLRSTLALRLISAGACWWRNSLVVRWRIPSIHTHINHRVIVKNSSPLLTVGQLSVDCWPFVGPTNSQLLADGWPTVGQQSTDSFSQTCRLTDNQLSVTCRWSVGKLLVTMFCKYYLI